MHGQGKRVLIAAAITGCLHLTIALADGPGPAHLTPAAGSQDRSPVDVEITADGLWAITANQTSDSASLVQLESGEVLDELAIGAYPIALARAPSSPQVLAVCRDAGDAVLLQVGDRQLQEVARIRLGWEPSGVAVAADGGRAWVSLTAADEVVELSLPDLRILRRITVGRQPRNLAVNAAGDRLAVGVSGERGVCVVDLEQGRSIYVDRFVGLNVGHLQTTRDGQYAYFPWMVYRNNRISPTNIRLGWVLASRIARIRLDQPERREAMSLDPRGQAIADPYGLRLTSDEQRLVVSAGGTHELLCYEVNGLPLKAHGGPDHIDPELLADHDRFFRIELGGRPMGLRIAADDRTVLVANYLLNSIQVVDLQQRSVHKSIYLGGSAEPSLERQGAAIFYDARRSLDQWYSCHSCHYEGGGNATPMDTLNDGSANTFKTVLPLFGIGETGPWTWHGWQTDLQAAMRKSMLETMQGSEPGQQDVDAILAFLKSLRLPPNPYVAQETPAAERGEALFFSSRTGCADCHRGPRYTDGQIHDVGLGSRKDVYSGFNTPSLNGVYRRSILLHDGRAESLAQLLKGPHNPQHVAGEGPPLNDQEIEDLVAFLKTL